MDYGEKQLIVDRIITGIIYSEYNKKLYKLVAPNTEQRALASLVYSNTLSDSKYDNLMTREQAASILHTKGLWTNRDDKNLEEYNKLIEQLKIQLYQAIYKDKRHKQNIRKKIIQIEKAISNGLSKKYGLDTMTLEYMAENAMNEFLIAICIYDKNNNSVTDYNNYRKSDYSLVQHFINIKSKNFVSSKKLRELARSEPFRSLWSIGKERVFGTQICDLTSDQKSLIMYSKMYDNVYDHPERPNEDVINDDYMLDGWFALERNKSQQAQKDREAEKLLNKKGVGNKAGDLFIPVGSNEEANIIRDLNDLNAKMKAKQRDAVIKNTDGAVEEGKLPDVKLDLQNQAMRQMADKFKGKQ
jgi:hypothetical protein